jgi:hypothetical protein
MRGFAFSSVLAGLLLACGAKPAPDTSSPAISQVSPAGAVEFLNVTRRVELEVSNRPPGARLRLAATELGDLFVLDSDHHRVLRYGQDGRLLGEAGGSGSGTQQFNSPVDLATDGLTIWVLDRQNRRLVRLNRDLNFVEEISLVAAQDDFTTPLWYDALASSGSGDIFLLDRREPQAVRISPAGEVLAVYGGFGMGSGRLEAPTDLAANVDGSLYIADGRNLLYFDRSGNLKSTWTYTEPILFLECGEESVWLVTGSGGMALLQDGQLRRVVVDPAAGTPSPSDVTVGPAARPAVLTAGLEIWLLSPLSD